MNLLPTEEDVLAALDDLTPFEVEAVIADSERRLAIETAEQAIINAALEWEHIPTTLAEEGLLSALKSLRLADRALSEVW